jgi:hypothetical protein
MSAHTTLLEQLAFAFVFLSAAGIVLVALRRGFNCLSDLGRLLRLLRLSRNRARLISRWRSRFKERAKHHSNVRADAFTASDRVFKIFTWFVVAASVYAAGDGCKESDMKMVGVFLLLVWLYPTVLSLYHFSTRLAVGVVYNSTNILTRNVRIVGLLTMITTNIVLLGFYTWLGSVLIGALQHYGFLMQHAICPKSI